MSGPSVQVDLSPLGAATAKRPETFRAEILTVDDSGDSGTLERTSDNKEFQFTIGGGADGGDGGDGGDPRGSITVEPSDLVRLHLDWDGGLDEVATIVIITGGSEERAIVIEVGGADE